MIDGTGRILRRHRRCCHWDFLHHEFQDTGSVVSYAPDGGKVSLSQEKGNHSNEEAELNRFTARARPLTIPSCILRAVSQRPVRQPLPPSSRAFPHSVCLVCAQRTTAASAGPRELQTSTPCASLKIPPPSHLSIPRHARR